MMSLFNRKHLNITKVTSSLIVGIFTICLLTGFLQSVSGLFSDNLQVDSCCHATTSSDCHSNSSETDSATKGLCSTEKLTFKSDSEKGGFAADKIILTSTSIDAEIHQPSVITFDQLDFQRNIHSPPIYLLTYCINAPPIS